MKVSQTYIPGKSVRLLLQSFEDDPRHNKEHPPAESEDDTEGPLHLGMANGWRRNQAYKNLMVDAELDKLQNQEILEYFSGMVHNKKNTSQGSLGSDFKYWRIIESIDDSIKAAVIWLTGKRWKIRTISRTLEISELECRTLINENKYRQKLEKTIKNKFETSVLHTNEPYICGKEIRGSEHLKKNYNCKPEELSGWRVPRKTVVKSRCSLSNEASLGILLQAGSQNS